MKLYYIVNLTNYKKGLINPFAQLIISNSLETVNFSASLQFYGESGLQILLRVWLKNFQFFTGFQEIKTK